MAVPRCRSHKGQPHARMPLCELPLTLQTVVETEPHWLLRIHTAPPRHEGIAWSPALPVGTEPVTHCRSRGNPGQPSSRTRPGASAGQPIRAEPSVTATVKGDLAKGSRTKVAHIYDLEFLLLINFN